MIAGAGRFGGGGFSDVAANGDVRGPGRALPFLYHFFTEFRFFPVRSPDDVTFALFCPFLHRVFAARTGDTRGTLPFLYHFFTGKKKRAAPKSGP